MLPWISCARVRHFNPRFVDVQPRRDLAFGEFRNRQNPRSAPCREPGEDPAPQSFSWCKPFRPRSKGDVVDGHYKRHWTKHGARVARRKKHIRFDLAHERRQRELFPRRPRFSDRALADDGSYARAGAFNGPGRAEDKLMRPRRGKRLPRVEQPGEIPTDAG